MFRVCSLTLSHEAAQSSLSEISLPVVASWVPSVFGAKQQSRLTALTILPRRRSYITEVEGLLWAAAHFSRKSWIRSSQSFSLSVYPGVSEPCIQVG